MKFPKVSYLFGLVVVFFAVMVLMYFKGRHYFEGFAAAASKVLTQKVTVTAKKPAPKKKKVPTGNPFSNKMAAHIDSEFKYMQHQLGNTRNEVKSLKAIMDPKKA